MEKGKISLYLDQIIWCLVTTDKRRRTIIHRLPHTEIQIPHADRNESRARGVTSPHQGDVRRRGCLKLLAVLGILTVGMAGLVSA